MSNINDNFVTLSHWVFIIKCVFSSLYRVLLCLRSRVIRPTIGLHKRLECVQSVTEVGLHVSVVISELIK